MAAHAVGLEDASSGREFIVARIAAGQPGAAAQLSRPALSPAWRLRPTGRSAQASSTSWSTARRWCTASRAAGIRKLRAARRCGVGGWLIISIGLLAIARPAGRKSRSARTGAEPSTAARIWRRGRPGSTPARSGTRAQSTTARAARTAARTGAKPTTARTAGIRRGSRVAVRRRLHFTAAATG
jgi:hypothetical protein